MKKVRLGKSGLEVSKVGFGGIPIQRVSEEEAVAVVRRAIDLGVNWIDTANGYGTSEERIGKAIGKYKREELILSSKSPEKDADKFRANFELSLERMGVEYLDIFHFHFVRDAEDWRQMVEGGVVGEMLRLRDAGLVRHVAASSHNVDAILAVMDHEAIEIVQWPFNFIEDRDAIRVLEKCETNDIGFIAMKPFGGGMLGDASAAIRFLMQFEQAAADPGFETIEQVEEVVAIAEEAGRLSGRDIEAIARIKEELDRRFCRRCGYCGPCEQGVNIILLMEMESISKRVAVEQFLGEQFAAASESVRNCTLCGVCETKCPYSLPIREIIRHGKEYYDRFRDEHS